MVVQLSPAQVSRSEKNVVRDAEGHVHLGQGRTVKRLFASKAAGIQRFAKSEPHPFKPSSILFGRVRAVWQVLALVQRLLQEGKVATQREAYYCLVQHFCNQGEFNDTLQGKA